MSENHQKTKGVIGKILSMDENTWARHANPLSVWTRVITVLPMLLLAIWSIRDLGYWGSLVIGGVCFWIWLNPRLFPAPISTNNWASKVTFGERIWLNRKNIVIPEHHVQWALFLSLVTGSSFFVCIYGAYQHDLLLTASGGLVSWMGKMWFCDRMVWLFENMRESHEEYNMWLR